MRTVLGRGRTTGLPLSLMAFRYFPVRSHITHFLPLGTPQPAHRSEGLKAIADVVGVLALSLVSASSRLLLICNSGCVRGIHNSPVVRMVPCKFSRNTGM